MHQVYLNTLNIISHKIGVVKQILLRFLLQYIVGLVYTWTFTVFLIDTFACLSLYLRRSDVLRLAMSAAVWIIPLLLMQLMHSRLATTRQAQLRGE
jgi:hypothetical protein